MRTKQLNWERGFEKLLEDFGNPESAREMGRVDLSIEELKDLIRFLLTLREFKEER